MSAETNERLSAIEKRLAQLEIDVRRKLNPTPQDGDEGSAPAPTLEPAPAAVASTGLPLRPRTTQTSVPADDFESPADRVRRSELESLSSSSDLSATRILGWGGATALVLAAGYLIRLAVADGWLTPTRQIALAVVAGIALIAAGMKLKETDREYASLLPAGGIVIFFLSVYGAHLFYELIGASTAGVAVMAVCLGSLVLCSIFNSQLYAFFAVIGSYSAPFLLGDSGSEIVDLVVYFSCWSVVFSIFAVWVKDRRVYLLALYLALVGFDVLWKMSADEAWIAIVAFQFLQLLIFATCAVVYAVRHNEPMTQPVAMVHAPALLIFYALEYAVLEKHVPGIAPWVAVISAAVLIGAYQIARRYQDDSLGGSKLLLAAYCALVLLHAGYLESVPDGYGPWVALLLMILGAASLLLPIGSWLISGPIGWVIGAIFAGNYARLIFDLDSDEVPASDLLLVLYAVQLYVGYYFTRQDKGLSRIELFMIYGGHIAAMTAAVYVLDNRFAVSIAWAVLALGCLMLALRFKDKALGQSSLLIFGASAIKVFLVDLGGSQPVVRIACLAALGVSLYAGGWLYRKVETLEVADQT